MLDANKVRAVFVDSLFKDGEPTDDMVKVEGITANVGFHPQRLESHREEIIGFLRQLPDSFMKFKGGGMSFLNAAEDREGNLWGQHQNMQELFMLGMGIGRVTAPLPQALWGILPGGMPYYTVDVEEEKGSEVKQ